MSSARRELLPRLTDRLTLPGGASVSPVALGITGDPTIVEAAFERGINFFFLSNDLYWWSFRHLAAGLERLAARGVREQLVLAVASYVGQSDFAIGPYREVLDSFPTLARLDLMVLGGIYARDWEHRRAFAHEARPRLGSPSLAASFHDRRTAAAAIRAGELDVAFVRYNPAHPGAARDLFPEIGERTTRVYNFNSTHGWNPAPPPDGGWHPTHADHYRFALTRPELDGLLVTLDDHAQLDALEHALARGPLTAGEEAMMIERAVRE